MKPIPFNMKGTEYALTIKIATYPEGNLAIKLYQESFGQLVFWDSLTVNLGGLCPKDCGFINTKSTGKRFYAWIKRNGLGERTGQVRLEDGVGGNAPARSGWKTAWNMWNTSSTPKS